MRHFATLHFFRACFSPRSFSDILDALLRYRAMDTRYYEVFRRASQEAFYQAVNNPEDELYDIVWDLFETAVIEPGEIFDNDFRNQNQFRYSINSGVTLEFFPGPSYFRRRVEPNPYEDDSDAAGIHMQFSILPCMSCLFSVGFRVWGRPERIAFKQLWRQHRGLLSDTFRRAKPMVFTAASFPSVDYASTLEDMLDNYFSVRDSEHYIELQYSFAQFDEIDNVQNFMVYMAFLYHSIKDQCQQKKNRADYWSGRVRDFYSGYPPNLPAPLPCVEMTITSDTE